MFGVSRWKGLPLVIAMLAPGSPGNTAWAQEGNQVKNLEKVLLDEPDSDPPPIVVQRHKMKDDYTDGTVRVQREVIRLSNDRLLNDGPFQEFYENGQPFSEGTYKRGILNGQWKYWHDNGQICKTTTFKDGVPNGSWEVFRRDGSRSHSKTYESGLRHGKWIRYYEDGDKIKTEENYDQGKLTGTRISNFPSGKKRQEAHFTNGLLNGLMTEWDEDGKQISQIEFKDGKPVP